MDQQLILDRYRPLQELAHGGFGDVVLAYDTRMQRRVAIKRLPFPTDRAGRPLEPVGLAEARTAAMLNHPNIVTVHEWDTDADEAFLIMEFVEGATIADILEDRDEPLDLDETAAVVQAISSAVGFAHDNGVLHLDIKPENVLVSRDGRIKVTDFGIAALSTASGHGPAIGGTLGYMPLEQLRDGDVDERTDVWAFAVLVFEMLTYANPFASDTIEGAIFKAEVVEPPTPGEFEPRLPQALDDIELAALAVDPQDRYASVTAFAERLLPYLGTPEIGLSSLAQSAEEFLAEDHVEPVTWNSVGLWDRAAPYGAAAVRLLSGAVAAWLAWAGLRAFGVDALPTYGAAALVALAAVLAPGLGTLVGAALFIAGLAASGWWWLAAGLALSGMLVWWFAGRHGAGFAGALASPALGVGYAAPAAPLLLGFGLPPISSAMLSAYAGAMTMVASAGSGGRAPYLLVDWRYFVDPYATRVTGGGIRALLSDPAPLAILLGWAIGGFMMSLFCSRGSRPLALAGLLMGVAAIWGGCVGADLIAQAFNGSATWAGEALLPHLTASSILMVLVIAAGPPPRAEEE